MAANPFTAHPASVGETYLGHLCAAARFGLLLLLAGTACLVHAVCPWLCTHSARDRVARLHAELQRRSGATAPAPTPGGARYAIGSD